MQPVFTARAADKSATCISSHKHMKEWKGMKREGIIKAVVLSVMAMFISGMVWAAGDKPADNMQIVRDKLHADKKFLIATNMKLTESEAKLFWPVYDSYQKDLIKLNDRVIKNISDYAANFDKMSDDLAKKVVTEHLAIESDRVKLMQSYLPKFAKTLPYKKVMRYYQLENKISAVVYYEAAKKIPLAD
jgi:hypothetical protein